MKALQYPPAEDRTKELGRLNFFLVNQTNFYIKDFLKVNILDNCIFVIVVDVEDPDKIQQSVQRWVNFIEHQIEMFMVNAPQEDRKEVLEHFETLNKKIQNLKFNGESLFLCVFTLYSINFCLYFGFFLFLLL